MEHPLLIADDHLGSVELLEALEPVVAIDHAPIEIVQIAGREAAAIQRHERAEVRRNYRDDLQDHVFGLIARLAEGVEHFEALGDLLALGLAGRLAHLDTKPLALFFNVQLSEHFANGFSADADFKCFPPPLLAGLGEHLVVEEIAKGQVRLTRLDDDERLEIENLLDVAQRDLENVSDARWQRFQEPDVRHRGRQRDVPHSFAAHLGLDHFDAALLTYDTTVLHALVLSAVTLVILYRAEDLGAEQPVAFRLESPVVDRLWLLDFAKRPLPNFFR